VRVLVLLLAAACLLACGALAGLVVWVVLRSKGGRGAGRERSPMGCCC
jgi:hypothetical protein